MLGAVVSPGSSLLAERLASTVSQLVERGMDAGAAAKAATGLLGRATAGQATVIAFDTAFNIVALLFVVAAPVLVSVKIGLAHSAARRNVGIEAAKR